MTDARFPVVSPPPLFFLEKESYTVCETGRIWRHHSQNSILFVVMYVIIIIIIHHTLIRSCIVSHSVQVSVSPYMGVCVEDCSSKVICLVRRYDESYLSSSDYVVVFYEDEG